MADNYGNFAYSFITIAPTPATTGTNCQVDIGSRFPTPPFKAFIIPFLASSETIAQSHEIVHVTAMSGDSITAMTRAYEGTTARAIIVGDQFIHGPLASDIYIPTYEVPTGAINDVNTTYTLSATPKGAVIAFQNGLALIPGVDYTVSGNQVTWTVAPATGDTIAIAY